MSRSEEFEAGRTFFHGTKHDFSYGLLLPSDALPHRSDWKEMYDQPQEAWRKSRVFASTHEGSAWTWGQGPGRPRVHEVELTDAKEGPFPGEWNAKRGVVKRTHWAPPPKPGHWVQPSLPPLNWEQHGGRHWTDDQMAEIERQIADERRPAPPEPATYEGQGALF